MEGITKKTLSKISGNYIYIIVLVLLSLLVVVIWLYTTGEIKYETARVYIEALTGTATLALLYYAYFNVNVKRLEDISRFELAVRPILIWSIENREKKTYIKYKTIKHPIYDLKIELKCKNKTKTITEAHLDVSDQFKDEEVKRDITDFLNSAIKEGKKEKCEIKISYHSEAGGEYQLYFTKVIWKSKSGFAFEQRQFESAKYPWRADEVIFKKQNQKEG